MKIDSFKTLTTDRLVLRKLIITDHEEIFKLRSDAALNKYLDRPIAKSLEDAREFIHKILLDTENSNWNYWAITLKNKNKLIGTICLWNILENRDQAEIGFELLSDYQGKGIMRESITSVLKYGFETLHLLMISAVVHPENSRSIKLLDEFHFTPDLDKTLLKKGELRYILKSVDYK